MSFNPRTEYTIVPADISIKDFHEYKEDFVTRPPYQRKAVWSRGKKQALMDSLFRRYYIPRLVIREVRLSDSRTVKEIIDGQQRITTVQDFFENQYALPATLADIDKDLPGAYYKDLSTDVRKFIDKELKYQTDIIKNIDKPNDVQHQLTATEIFWRLQQGESLNYMEVAHAQLSSLTRNFIVKYSDDETFDYKEYKPIDENPDKLPFFSLLNVSNERMKHLQFMTRFLLIEKGGGYADVSDGKVGEFIQEAKVDNGIGSFAYEKEPEAQAVLKNLRLFYDIFKDDPMRDAANGIKELSVEYFIMSVYLLIRHLGRYYVVDAAIKEHIRSFVYDFHERWKTFDEQTDHDLLSFSNRRQQSSNDMETRDRILRQIFFEYSKDKGVVIKDKDEKRAFSELERITIYRKANGLCAECIREGKPELEARVSWSQYQADHVVPHSKGGRTTLANGQLLCGYHNASLGAKNKSRKQS